MSTAVRITAPREDTKKVLGHSLYFWKEHLIQLPIFSPGEINLTPQQLNKKHETHLLVEMISSPAVVTPSLFSLFPYSQMPLLSTLSQSLQNKDLLPIRAFSLHFRKTYILKDMLQMIQMSLQGIQHLSSGSDLGYPWHSEKEANGRERTCPHSPCFCHLC